MTDDDFRLTIVGVGLLGGSVAKAIRRTHPNAHVRGVSRRPSTLERAFDAGVIDQGFEHLADACVDSDVVVIATPVDRLAGYVIQAAHHTPTECLITDVGSTKAGIVNDVGDDADAAAKFVAAHPIAGSEKTGVENATDDLFDGKVIILTPTAANGPAVREKADQFWRATGGRCLEMTPEEHDDRLAAISHVPHLMSSLVAKLTDPESLPLAGSGWRDITRVAAGDPEMWTAICQQNRSAVLDQLRRCADELKMLHQWIETRDDAELCRWLADAQAVRWRSDESDAGE
ncbi:prephenate dehydrogenase [Crateriforma conspicua]|uniref:Prephenate dehydrogenase n=1 Tax=Crateriforma conspicua TaxID=2527996 RepID=A0A5C6FHT6_9PLAN|nr:prephenate dehydrogenase/arogenate dehydrogenase family protein [Crateriforma conspicua]TWU61063.1 prephenate dehydrogenase [Crateriforma conspicua]